MKLFAGLSRTDYEDVFRAVGALIDERGWTNVSLMEVEEGLILQVMIKPGQRELKAHLETYLLTDADLERILRDAVLRRKKKEQEKPASPALAQPAIQAPPPPSSTPSPSKMIEGLLATKSRPSATPDWPSAGGAVADGFGAMSRESAADFTDVASQVARITRPRDAAPPAPLLSSRPEARTIEDDIAPFAPEPMRLSQQPPEQKYDSGAARAAVVMAHIVAARIKSGVPITSDDPDLASLLEQVRALDESNIGEG